MIHSGHHINVVNLLGAVTKNLFERKFMIIVEYCPFGSLQDFLKNNFEKFVDQIDCITGNIDENISQNVSKNLQTW